MKKLFFILIFSLLFCCSAFASEVKLKSAEIDNDGTLAINGQIDTLAIDQQLTVAITPLVEGSYSFDSIICLEQQAIENTNFTLNFQLTLDDGYYVARIGGNGIPEPRFILIVRKDKEYSLKFGDVNNDGRIDATDAANVMQYVLNKAAIDLTPLQLYAANVINNSELDASCAAWILSKTLNGSILFPVENI